MNLTKLFAALAVCAAFAIVPASAQANACTSASFAGGYGYALSTSGFDGNGNVFFAAWAGRLVSDGNGNITGRDTMNVAGIIVRRTCTGTYFLNPDCAGSMTLQVQAAGQTATGHSDIVVVNGGNDVDFVQTDPGLALSGAFKAQ